jgi:N-acetylglucosaminyldiphosphoundecaprenol N-acetyl-beta-D-mannosaminyltransferase
MKTIDILGVKVDKVTPDEAVGQIREWTEKGGRHFVVTPNVEIIMASRTDKKFKSVLNGADLSIPDSARIGWAYDILQEKNIFLKILKWPLFILPKNSLLTRFDIVTGVDFMDTLLSKAEDWGSTVGFLGGQKKLAEALRERLEKKYPKLEVSFLENGGVIDYEGNQISEASLEIPKTDILFVAFGHIKQEKWIAKNLANHPVKVMIGVGGAFDYLSGNVPRASRIIRSLGFEWLYRLILQPWRIKRFGALLKFVFLVLIK